MAEARFTYLIQAVTDFSALTRAQQRLGRFNSQVNRGLTGLNRGFQGMRDRINGVWMANNDLMRSLRRVAVVVPVWMAFRAIVSGIMNDIRAGLTHIKEFDKGMARATAVMRNVDDIQAFQDRLRGVVRSLGVNFGVSAQQATEAFYRFGTAGFDAEASIQGAVVALRTSIAMMGDSTQTARGLADVYNLMGDRIEGATTSQEKMQVVGSTIAMLWRSNAFELSEFLSGMKNFLTTAKGFNLTLDESLGTLAILHTLMRRGSQAGTEMSRSLIMLTRRSRELNNFLGRMVDPQTERQFDILLEVLRKLNTRLQEGRNIASDVANVFGIKGMKSTQALANELPRLIEQFEKLREATPEDRMRALNELFNLRINTIDRQIKIQEELRKQNVELFLQSVTGATDYVDALKNINAWIRNTIIPTNVWWGNVIQGIIAHYRMLGDEDIDLSVKVGLALPQTGALFSPIAIEQKLRSAFEEVATELPSLTPVVNFSQEIIDKDLAQIEKRWEQFIKRFRAEDAVIQFRMLREELKLTQKEAMGFFTDPFDRTRIQLSESLKSISEINEELSNMPNNARLAENAMYGIVSATLKVKDAFDLIIKGETNFLKQMGAFPSQVLSAKFALEDMLLPEKLRTDLLVRQLQLLQEQRKEVMGITQLSRETVEIAKIARRFGEDVAKEIAKAIVDPREIENLSRRASFLFRRRFQSRYEQFQARQFFFEQTVGGGLRPRTDIPIPEVTRLGRAPQISAQPIVNLPSIEVNIDPSQLQYAIIELIKNEMENPKSVIYDKIQQIIDNF